MSAAFCSKDSATGDYCVLALNEAMDPFEDGLSKEGLDVSLPRVLSSGGLRAVVFLFRHGWLC